MSDPRRDRERRIRWHRRTAARRVMFDGLGKGWRRLFLDAAQVGVVAAGLVDWPGIGRSLASIGMYPDGVQYFALTPDPTLTEAEVANLRAIIEDYMHRVQPMGELRVLHEPGRSVVGSEPVSNEMSNELERPAAS